GLVVAAGPGSFTGLRVGMAVAKGLALALGIPLVGVGTLEASAYPFAWSTLPVWAMVDAGRGEVAAACFQTRRGAWRKVWAEAVVSPEELVAAVSGRALFCGEVPPAVEALLHDRLGRRALLPPGLHRIRRAGYLGRLGWERLQRGEADDPATLAPLYLRRPAVLER
ncbi:MAG: tRNA (adenosine(37)-N6)-threonylcarbamoyltransferase complex dimerization subunit type 1 TsaB, partial [Chloroflexi bacterium]|nr:tRNA (adenosine(37)-N6)-threonylcarbamoyltransferase complex dimerization subunit type 1 TsaB [Chloroflexota bacterium]